MTVDGLKIEVEIAKRGLKRSEFCLENKILPQTMWRVIKSNKASTLTAVKIANGLGMDIREILSTANQN